MKLSNNAIKFLMAQYRAIYKNAYFKGIASAVVLTAGLAAGTAQAAPTTGVEYTNTNANAFAALSGSGNTGTFKVTQGTLTNTKAFELTISGDGNKIDGSTNASSVTASKGTIILADAAKLVVESKAANSGAELTVDVLKLDGASTLEVKGTGKSGTVTANTVNLGSGGTVNIGASGALAATYVKAAGGTIKFADSGSLSAVHYFEKDTDKTAQKMNLSVTANKSVKSANTGDATKGRGVLDFASGSVVSFGTHTATYNGLVVSGNASVGDVVKFQAGSKITATGAEASGAAIVVKGSGTSLSEVHIDSDVLSSFLAADGDKAGSFLLKDASKLVITGKDLALGTAVDNAVLVTISGSAAKDGVIGVSGDAGVATVAADNITVNSQIGDGNLKLNLETAGTLTIDKTSFTQAHDGAGFKAATAKNLTLVGKKGAAELVETVKLKSSDTGTISGDALLSGSANITVEEGVYTAAGAITVSGGTIGVAAADGKTATLNLTGAVQVDSVASSAVSVTGKGATLDLTNATSVKGKSGAKSAAVTVNAGILKIKGDDLKTLITASSDSGSLFGVSNGGTVNAIAGEAGMELDAGSIKKEGLDAKGININGGNLKVTGSLTLTGTSADIGTGTIQADSLTFKNDTVNVAAGKYIALSSLGAVKADGTTTTALGLSGAAVTLGSKDAPDAEGSLTSDINVGSTTSGTLTVAGGVWGDQSTSMTVAVAGSKLQVGGFYAKDTDQAAGKPPVAATLKLDTLTGTSGTVTVAEGSSLVLKTLSNANSDITIAEGASATANKLTTTGGKLKISGSMSVKGDSTDTTNKGVSLVKDNKTVVVTDKGFLEFGSTAVGSMLTADGDAFKLGTDLKGFTASSIDLQTGGTVKFSFDSGVSLEAKDLKTLRGVFGVADGALTAGVLDLGNATITGVTGEGGVVVDGKVAWKDIKGFADVNSDVVNKDLADVIVTNISEDVRGNFGSLQQAAGSTDEQIGISTSSSLSGADKNNGLFASDSTGKKVVGLNVKNGTLTLNDSGKVGKVTLNGSSVLKLNAGQTGSITVQGDVNGKAAELLVNTGTANVTGAANIGFLDSVKGSTLNAASLNASSATDENTVNGNLNVTGDASFAGALKLSGTASVGTFTAKSTLDTAKGSALKVTTGAFTADKTVDAQGTIEVTGSGPVATFKAEAELAADGNKFVDVNFDMDAAILGNTEAAGKVNVGGESLAVIDGATLKADTLTLKTGTNQFIRVGTVGTSEMEQPPTDPADVVAPSSAYLSAKNLELNGGFIVVDPDYEQGASIAAVKNLTNADTTKGTHAGQVKGQILALQNSIVSLGNENIDAVKATFAKYLDSADGSLNQEQLGSIVYVANSIKLGSSDKIVIDGKASDYALEKALRYSKCNHQHCIP